LTTRKKPTRRRDKVPAGEEYHANGNGVIRSLIAQTAGLAAKVEAQTTVIGEMARQHRAAEESASRGRAEMHNKIDMVKDDVRRAQGDVAQVARDVATMQPIVTGLAQRAERVVGAGILAKFLWIAGGSIVTGLLALLAWLLHLIASLPWHAAGFIVSV
jgi:hypothetical protein